MFIVGHCCISVALNKNFFPLFEIFLFQLDAECQYITGDLTTPQLVVFDQFSSFYGGMILDECAKSFLPEDSCVSPAEYTHEYVQWQMWVLHFKTVTKRNVTS